MHCATFPKTTFPVTHPSVPFVVAGIAFTLRPLSDSTAVFNITSPKTVQSIYQLVRKAPTPGLAC